MYLPPLFLAATLLLAASSWSATEVAALRQAFNSLKGTPMTPGNYIVGRYTNFAFLDAYDNGDVPSDAMLSYIDEINKEITRKRQEFGLETLEIGDTLAKKRVRQYFEAVEKLPEDQQSTDLDRLTAEEVKEEVHVYFDEEEDEE